jgi:hypothetical protein
MPVTNAVGSEIAFASRLAPTLVLYGANKKGAPPDEVARLLCMTVGV